MTTHTVQLEQVADVFPGHYEKGSGTDDPGGTHRLVFIGSIDPAPGHRLLPEKCPRFTPKSDPKDAVLQANDLVIPARGERQTVARIADAVDNRRLIAASFLHVIRPRPNEVDSGYLAWWLNQSSAQARIAGFVRGSKMPFLPLSATREIRVSLPPLDTQRRIANLHLLALREYELTTALRDQRQRLLNALASRVVTGRLQ